MLKKIFKVIIAKIFDLQPNLKEIRNDQNEALLELNDETDDKKKET